MAGGKVSARQKMINLMYLVFIAMMAMNMSKEVLNAFGLMSSKFSESTTLINKRNVDKLNLLIQKGEEQKADFALSAERGKIVREKSQIFIDYLEDLKKFLIARGDIEIDPKTNQLKWGEMDNSSPVDEAWFTGDRLTKNKGPEGVFSGDGVMEAFKNYRNDIIEIFGKDAYFKPAIDAFKNRFSTEEAINEEGVLENWLKFNFEGYPLVATYTRLTSYINDVSTTESSLLNLLLGNANEEAYGLDKNKAIVLADKSTFFAGEKFQGKVVIGKYADVPPIKLNIQGEDVDLTKAIDSNGAARLDFNVGSVGEHEISGVFTVLQKGKELEIPITGNYVVVPRPQEASVAADKMNVLYQDLNNPITISFPGVPDNKVTARARGLRKLPGQSKYIVKPSPPYENDGLTINVSAELDDGSVVSSTHKFRIKQIPPPVGEINGKSGSIVMNRGDLEAARIIAKLKDFLFDLPIEVYEFNLVIPGLGEEKVRADRIISDSDARRLLKNAPRNAYVLIQDIKVRNLDKSQNVQLDQASGITIKLSN
jgi:gliding motility-associated protein GldM